MSQLNIPNPTTPGNVLVVWWTAAKNAIEAVINGGIDDTNIASGGVKQSNMATNSVGTSQLAAGAVRQSHADYTQGNVGLLVPSVGPNYQGSNGGRLAFFSMALTRAGADATEAFAVVYATHCVDGDPVFASAPLVFGLTCRSATESTNSYVFSAAPTATGFTVTVTFGGATDEAAVLTGALWGPKS